MLKAMAVPGFPFYFLSTAISCFEAVPALLGKDLSLSFVENSLVVIFEKRHPDLTEQKASELCVDLCYSKILGSLSKMLLSSREEGASPSACHALLNLTLILIKSRQPITQHKGLFLLEIFAEVVALREGRSLLIRGLPAEAPLFQQWKEFLLSQFGCLVGRDLLSDWLQSSGVLDYIRTSSSLTSCSSSLLRFLAIHETEREKGHPLRQVVPAYQANHPLSTREEDRLTPLMKRRYPSHSTLLHM